MYTQVSVTIVVNCISHIVAWHAIGLWSAGTELTLVHMSAAIEHLLKYQKNGNVVDNCGFHDFHCAPHSSDNMYQVKRFKSEDIVQA